MADRPREVRWRVIVPWAGVRDGSRPTLVRDEWRVGLKVAFRKVSHGEERFTIGQFARMHVTPELALEEYRASVEAKLERRQNELREAEHEAAVARAASIVDGVLVLEEVSRGDHS